MEFDSVLYLLSSYCKSQKAKDNALKLNYFASPQLVSQEFDLLFEIKTIYEDNITTNTAKTKINALSQIIVL